MESIFNYKKIGILFKKELRFFFFSPIAYIFICIFLVLTGWFFFSRFFLYNQVEMRGFFELLPVFLALVIPAVTMGLFSEEFSMGSYEMISTTSVTVLDIILGKFLAACAFMMIALAPTLLYPVSISFLGELDIGPVIGGYIGSVFLTGALTSIGLLASSLSKNQIVSLIIALAVCFFLSFILGFMKSFTPAALTGVIEFISADAHFNNIAKGVLDWRDLLYFLSIMVVALYSTKLVLERRK